MSFSSEMVPLKELGEIVSGSTPSTQVQEYWGGDIPWITPADLTDHDGVYFTGKLRTITKAGYDSCSTKMLPPGTILFSSRAPIGHCAVATYPLCTNQGFKSIVPRQGFNPVYGFFALKRFTPKIIALGRGATFAEINKELFGDFEIPLPSLPEQQRIAGILSRADRLRRLRRYALEMSESYLQTVFLAMFGDPARNPMGWETDRLRKLCAKVVDCLHSTPNHTRLKTPYPCIRSSDIQNGRLDWSTTLYVDSEQYALRVERLVPQPGDVVYCREGARLGNAAIIPTRTTLCLGQRMMLFRANPEVATPEFIWAMLGSRAIGQQVSATTGGSASPHINIQEINAFQVIVPPLTRQKEYSRIVQDYERLRIQKQEALRQAEHLFQTLLHQAFR